MSEYQTAIQFLVELRKRGGTKPASREEEREKGWEGIRDHNQIRNEWLLVTFQRFFSLAWRK